MGDWGDINDTDSESSSSDAASYLCHTCNSGMLLSARHCSLCIVYGLITLIHLFYLKSQFTVLLSDRAGIKPIYLYIIYIRGTEIQILKGHKDFFQ